MLPFELPAFTASLRSFPGPTLGGSAALASLFQSRTSDDSGSPHLAFAASSIHSSEVYSTQSDVSAAIAPRKLRVALVTQHYPDPAQPWAGNAAYQTIQALGDRCHVHVFYPQATYPSLLKAAVSPLTQGPAIWKSSGPETTFVRYPALPVISRAANGFSMARKLLPHVRRFNPDVILNYTVYPDGFAAVRIGQALRVPVVLTSIGSDLNRIPDPLCKTLTRYALRHADFVRTVSHDLCNTARTLGAGAANSRADLNGCDTSIFFPRDRRQLRRELGVEPDADAVVYIGRLDVRKGLIELIDAVGELRKKRDNLHCYIVGDGRDRPLLVEAIARNGAEAAITLVPACLNVQVAKWIGVSDLVTLPSYAEGCPNVVIEALASGRPVVATNVGGIPELMNNDSGALVPPRDSQALATALDEVLGRRWDAQVIGTQHDRSWTDVADELHDLLHETVQEHARKRA